ncbi:MAG: ribose ABC transporter permease [Bacteroidetes bacterium]|jgi:ribose transport system permease protein|nr:ribose ABC transporter permease [Bacteroidota bacterium]
MMTLNYLCKKISRKLDFSGEIFSIFLALIIMCVFFSFTSPYFFTIKNILNFTMNSSILGIMAAGLFISMVIGEIDVSQYSILALSTAVMAILIKNGTGIGLAITISMIVALICGAINGASVAFLRINPIITTLGTMLIYRAIAYKITEAKALGVEGDFFSAVGGRFLGIPVSVYIMLSVYIIVYVALKYTAYGKRVYAVGGNPQASFISGIDIRMVRFWGMMISAMAAALAGIIFVSQVGATVPTAGNTGLMDVVTAVILGGISLSGGKGKIEGTLIGVFILAILSNGMVLLSVQSYYQMLVKGLVILLAVYVDSVRGGGFK